MGPRGVVQRNQGAAPAVGVIVALLLVAFCGGISYGALPVAASAAVTVPPAVPSHNWPELDGGQWLTIAVLIGAPVILVILWFADVIRPGSFARAGVRDVGGHPWWVWLAAGGLVLLTGQFVASIVHASLRVPPFMELPLRGQVVVNASMALGGIAAGVALLRMLKAGAPSGGVTPRWSDLWTGVWCLILTLPIVLAVSVGSTYVFERISGHPPDRLAHETLKQIAGAGSDPWVWGLRVTAILLIPVYEELVFRVGLQTAALRGTRSPWLAILIATAIFTLAHRGAIPPHAMPVIAALSVCMGVAYERTKRLCVPMVMHALFNAVNVLMAMWG